MRVKILSLILVVSVVFAPSANAYQKLKFMWEYKLPPTKIAFQRVWAAGDMCIVFSDETKTVSTSKFQITNIRISDGKPLWEPLDEKSGYCIHKGSLVFEGTNLLFLNITPDEIQLVKFDLVKRCEIFKTAYSPFFSVTDSSITFGGFDGAYYWYYIRDYIVVLKASNGDKMFFSRSSFLKNAVVNGHVYIVDTQEETLTCWDIEKNVLNWKKRQSKGMYKYHLERDGRTYVQYKSDNRNFNNTLLCLDPLTGDKIWSKDFDNEFTVFWADAEKVALWLNQKNKKSKVLFLQAVDGKLITEVQMVSNDFTLEVNGSLLLAKVEIYCKPCEIQAFEIKTGKMLWKTASNHLYPPITYDDRIYYLDGVPTGLRYLRRVDPKNGKTIWVVTGKIHDMFSEGKTVLIVESGKISCYIDLN